MSSDRILLELSNDQSVASALSFLRMQGVNINNLTDLEMRTALRGKTKEVAEKMVAAYKHARTNAAPVNKDEAKPAGQWAPQKKDDGPAPPWAEGLSDWTIRKEDLTDANFVRKTLWELSGRPLKNPISLWTWDGERFGNHLVVLCNSDKFKEMAKAMVILNKNPKAVFMNGRSKNMLLLYTDGRFLNQPYVMAKTSNASNPNNDWDFIARLPRELIAVTKRLEAKDDHEAGDYKAWINVEKQKVHSFPVQKNYYEIIRENPMIFGNFEGTMSIKARLKLERAGWVACGVNSTDKGINAVVTSMTNDQALKAARMLFRIRFGKGDWSSLKVKTNEKQFECTSRLEIRDYLKSGKIPSVHYVDDDNA